MFVVQRQIGDRVDYLTSNPRCLTLPGFSRYFRMAFDDQVSAVELVAMLEEDYGHTNDSVPEAIRYLAVEMEDVAILDRVDHHWIVRGERAKECAEILGWSFRDGEPAGCVEVRTDRELHQISEIMPVLMGMTVIDRTGK